MTERQAFFAVKTRHEVLPHGPAFPIEQPPTLAVAVADPCLSPLPDSLPARGTGIARAARSIAGPRTADGLAGAPLTEWGRRAQIAHDHPLRRRP
jgi:hypothetical protein